MHFDKIFPQNGGVTDPGRMYPVVTHPPQFDHVITCGTGWVQVIESKIHVTILFYFIKQNFFILNNALRFIYFSFDTHWVNNVTNLFGFLPFVSLNCCHLSFARSRAPLHQFGEWVIRETNVERDFLVRWSRGDNGTGP